MTQSEEEECFKSYAKAMDEYYNEVNRVNNRILTAIKKVKGEEFYNDLISYIKEGGGEGIDGLFKLIREPFGDYQNEDFGEIRGVWIDEYSVGDSGDSFSGNICIQLKDNMWLEMPFNL